MGLDMYAFTTSEQPAAPVDFDISSYDELFYWRKHPNLHGWMERIYFARGGGDPEFNLTTLKLTAEDIDQLERDVTAGQLPLTDGFFFGSSDGEEREADLAFVAAAREALENGLTVFYCAWW